MTPPTTDLKARLLKEAQAWPGGAGITTNLPQLLREAAESLTPAPQECPHGEPVEHDGYTEACPCTISTRHQWFEAFCKAKSKARETPAPQDFITHLYRQREWSERTFGPGVRLGVIDHIRKELREIEAAPSDLSEWIDVAILAFDGAWRAGHSPEAIVAALLAKQAKNEARTWPDWRTMPTDKAIEHDRSSEATASASSSAARLTPAAEGKATGSATNSVRTEQLGGGERGYQGETETR